MDAANKKRPYVDHVFVGKKPPAGPPPVPPRPSRRRRNWKPNYRPRAGFGYVIWLESADPNDWEGDWFAWTARGALRRSERLERRHNRREARLEARALWLSSPGDLG